MIFLKLFFNVFKKNGPPDFKKKPSLNFKKKSIIIILNTKKLHAVHIHVKMEDNVLMQAINIMFVIVRLVILVIIVNKLNQIKFMAITIAMLLTLKVNLVLLHSFF